jgi:hypothetical protein
VTLPRFRLVTRRVPGTVWVQAFGSRTAETGRGWMYGGTVYRGCIRIPLVGYRLGLLVLPATCDPATYTGARRASYAAKFPYHSPDQEATS